MRSYYQTSYRVARLQGRFFRAVERKDAFSATIAFARFCGVCLNPMTNLRFFAEIVYRGFSATYADGVRGAIQGLADGMSEGIQFHEPQVRSESPPTSVG